MSQAKVSEWLHFLLPVLEDSLFGLGYMPDQGEEIDFEQVCETSSPFLMDVIEREIPRKTDNTCQKEEYSGKKKQHKVKNLVFCDTQKRIVFLSDLYEGKVHDKSLWDALELEVQGRNILLDLGFHGTEVLEAILPFKKPKNQELTKHQKAVKSSQSCFSYTQNRSRKCFCRSQETQNCTPSNSAKNYESSAKSLPNCRRTL